ncbi:MAG: DHH family phosphoesterase, partial [Rickettsiales bacterium]|nr:DHH family phosphoesterase [Rickettsiales bacterium]
MSIKVFGHKSPDTDSVISAIAAAYLLDGEPFVQGDLNRETRFVLEKFALAAPKRLESVAGESIALVDTSDPLHLPADIGDADIKYVFDHHNLGGIKTKGPFEGWFMPVGSTAAILFDYAKSKGVAIPADIAGAMAMAVISDTVLFKSPTTTGHDRRAVEELSEIAGIDYEKLGMEMLVVKSSIE